MFYKPYTMRFILCAFTTCLLLQFSANAQADRKIKIAGPSLEGKEYLFVAEIHSIEERIGFSETLIPYPATQHGVTDVVLEDSHSEAYLLNSYLQNDDTLYFKLYKDPDTRHWMDCIKLCNNTLPDGKKIKLHGMDFERMEFVPAVLKILNENEGTRNTELYRYLSAIPDSMYRKIRMTTEQHHMRIKLSDKAREFFSNEKEILRKVVKKDFETLELILENPTTEKHFAKRDMGMYRNIKKQLGNKQFLCITGMYHTEYTRYQVHLSLIRRIVKSKRHNAAKTTVFNEVRNGKFRSQQLFIHEGEQQPYMYGKAGPEYFTKNDSAMSRGYCKYFSPDSYTLAHKSEFKDLVRKDNHGLDAYYIFFGEWPPTQ